MITKKNKKNTMFWLLFFTFWGEEGVVIFRASDIGGGRGGGMGIFIYILYFCIVDHTRMRTSEGLPPVSGLCRTSGGRIGGLQ